MHRIFLYDKIYIPKAAVSEELLKKNWEFPVFDEPLCKPCDNKINRLNARCKLCPGYIKTIKMWGTQTDKNNLEYYTLPLGSIAETWSKLGFINNPNIGVDDRRCDISFDHALKFTGSLRTGEIIDGMPTANQQYLVNKWLETTSGLIQAPPRTGKSVLGVYLSCFLSKKTMIVAHQEELLMNFYKTYESMTNLKELREHTGKKIVKVIKKIEELDEEYYDVILVNYQKFIRDETGKDRIKKYLKTRYAFVAVDEVHSAGAQCFSKFLNQLTCKYRLGLTATPYRKDCVEGDTKVYTERGVLSMKEIFSLTSQGEKLRVYSKNTMTNEIELKPILELHKKTSDSLIELEFSTSKSILMTSDHQLY